MTSFVITWNPAKWPYDELIKVIEQQARTGAVEADWRFQAYRRAKPGDRIFLLKQGQPPRGIFGAGTIVRAPYRTDGESTGSAPVKFEILVDPMKSLLVLEHDVRFVLPPRVVNSQSSGVMIAEEKGEELDRLIRSANEIAHVPSAKRFADVLAQMIREGALSETDLAMLVCHHNAPAMTLTAREMSALMSWKGQTANGRYGALARNVGEALNWIPAERADLEGYYVAALVIGNRGEELEFQWILRPQVAIALRLLQWPELQASDEVMGLPPSLGVTERARHVWQQRLERDSRAAGLAKKAHGYVCQACGILFVDVYGEIGAQFIECII